MTYPEESENKDYKPQTKVFIEIILIILSNLQIMWEKLTKDIPTTHINLSSFEKCVTLNFKVHEPSSEQQTSITPEQQGIKKIMDWTQICTDKWKELFL